MERHELARMDQRGATGAAVLDILDPDFRVNSPLVRAAAEDFPSPPAPASGSWSAPPGRSPPPSALTSFDISAERPPILTFGHGVHFCLGAPLARAEMQEALPILAARLPGVELAGEPSWRPELAGFVGPVILPIRFAVASGGGAALTG
jgi:hypothetical protein